MSFFHRLKTESYDKVHRLITKQKYLLNFASLDIIGQQALFDATGVTQDPDFMYFVADVMATSVQYDFRTEVKKKKFACKLTFFFFPSGLCRTGWS
jgi:hypothetical protein